MSHAIVVARFQPVKTAYWLTDSAQAAAAKIPCLPFWALRFDLRPEFENGSPPVFLCALSSLPSTLPVPDASFTLGPKYAIDSGELSTNHVPGLVHLTVEPPLACLSQTLYQPIYLHATPTLCIAGARNIPIQPEACLHQLDLHSLRRFQQAAAVNGDHACNTWVTRKIAVLAERLPRSFDVNTLKRCVVLSSTADANRIFGERISPRTCCFDFVCDGPLPFCDRPTSIDDELLLYAQLCKDYRWEHVQDTIDWVEVIRTAIRDCPSRLYKRPAGRTLTDVPRHPPVSATLQQDGAFRSMLAAVSTLNASPTLHSDSDSDEDDETSTESHQSKRNKNTRSPRTHATGSDSDTSRSSGVWVWWLEFNNPTVASHFPRVQLRQMPRIIVLDMFGVILDREGAIRTALEPWLPLVRRRPDDAQDAVKLYIELEALTARELRSRATSVATIVHSTLNTLSTKLGVPPAVRPAFIADAAATILRPQVFDDAEPKIEEIARHGCTFVGLVPFSAQTLDALRPTIPPRILELVRFYPDAIPLHTPVPDTFFARLRRWCQEVLPTVTTETPAHDSDAYPPASVLVASAGMGRIIGPAAADAHSTALVMRDDGIEWAIEYVVGPGEDSPRASVSVGTLSGLAIAVRMLASGQQLVRVKGRPRAQAQAS